MNTVRSVKCIYWENVGCRPTFRPQCKIYKATTAERNSREPIIQAGSTKANKVN